MAETTGIQTVHNRAGKEGTDTRKSGRGTMRNIVVALAIVILTAGIVDIGFDISAASKSSGLGTAVTTTTPTTTKTSACPEPQGIWVGNAAITVRTVPGCAFIFQRDDVGPDLRIWINGDRSTAKRWIASSDPDHAPHFDETTRFAEVERWDKGSEEVYTLFSYPEK